MAETRRIRRLEQSEPVHAVCDAPKFSLRRMIGIEFGRAQSAHMDEIHLATDIDFGTVDIKIGDYNYTLSLASALVTLEKVNANIVTNSKYSDVLSAGEIDDKASQTKKTSSDSGFDVSAKAGFTSRFKVDIGAKSKRDRGQSIEATTKIKHQINLVSPEGQDSWRIGGPEGNPLLASKDLRGPVINSRHDEVARPLCTLEADDPDQSVSGRLRIQVNPSDFRLRGDAREAAAKDELSDGFARDQDKFTRREKASEQELRERVATMALLKPMRLPNRADADEGMFDLAARSFAFVPETDDGNG